jgi:hypothetical protein
MKKYLLILIIFVLTLFCSPAKIFAVNAAANISFAVPVNVHVGDTFAVLINADTTGQTINSVDISVSYDESLMSFVGYKDDNAVVKLWVQTPAEKNGIISMTGVIPGGVSGLYDPNQKGLGPIPIVQLLFLGKGTGHANLSFVKTEILKNDGQGTELPHSQNNAEVVITNNTSNTTAANQGSNFDNTPPEPFGITFVDSSFFSSTPPMIVFEASDIGSGIKYYQIKIGDGDWHGVESPAPISKSIFSRTIIVRAFDFYGNFQDSRIIIPGVIPTTVLPIIFIVFIVSGILGFKLLKYKA